MCYICRKQTKELCEVVEHYGLVNFTTLDKNKPKPIYLKRVKS